MLQRVLKFYTGGTHARHLRFTFRPVFKEGRTQICYFLLLQKMTPHHLLGSLINLTKYDMTENWHACKQDC